MTSVALILILVTLAVPSYQDAVEKRRITQGAELILAFVNTIQSESIKRNRPVTVAYSIGDDGQWCIGAVLGRNACDCMQTDPTESSWCELDNMPWVLRNSDVQARNLIHSASGDGSYQFDPVRGIFTDPSDALTLGLSAGDGSYQMSLNLVSTGRVSVCVPQASNGIHGFHACPSGS
ncbi:MAG: GspH/FimT family protein [Xanthomonadales bacterium]|nr:GspH/FimT family protein [Xanthomonadales bacterium]